MLFLLKAFTKDYSGCRTIPEHFGMMKVDFDKKIVETFYFHLVEIEKLQNNSWETEKNIYF